MFSTKGFGYDVSTKVTAVTQLNSFNVLACTGSAGSQANYWGEVVTATKSGDDYLTSKYWASTDPSITSFYASNAALTFNAAGPTVAPDGTVDVVCAHLSSPTYKVKNTLTFDHIYARVGTITLNTQTGYELSAVSATLKDRVSGGTYNIRLGAGQTDGTGWTPGAGSDAAAAAFSGSTSAQTSTNDLYVVPGSYSLQISYTLTKGSYVQTFTKTGSIALVAGKTNNITATAVGGAAAEIKFGVSITPWSANAIVLDLSNAVNAHPFSVSSTKTVYFANSNLLYDGTRSEGHRWCLMENPWDVLESAGSVTNTSSSKISLFGWGTSGYNGKNPWMQSTTNSEYGDGENDIAGTNYDWGVNNAIYSYGDVLLGAAGTFRTLTTEEWQYVCGGSGNRSGKTPAPAVVNGVNGILMFADDYSHPGGLTAIDRSWSGDWDDNVFAAEQFAQMCSAGAVFFPASGYRDGSSVDGVGNNGYYWSGSYFFEDYAYYLYLSNGGLYPDINFNRYIGYSVRLVKD